MTPASARKTLAAYVGTMASAQGSHVYLRPGSPPAIRVQGDMRVLPGAVLSSAYILALARGCMPSRREQQFDGQGRTHFVVRAIELERRFLIDVQQGVKGAELEIRTLEPDDEPPAFGHVPFDPARTPPVLSIEAEAE